MTGSEKVVSLLQSLLDRRDRDRAPARPARVLGRHEDGTETIQRLDAACVTRAPRDNHYAGTVVLSPSVSFVHRTGTTGIATITEAISAPTLWIETLDPSNYQPGHQYTVTVTGRGFDERTHIEFLEPSLAGPLAQAQTINPDIAVLEVLVVSPELLFLEITVAPAARLHPTPAPIAYGRK